MNAIILETWEEVNDYFKQGWLYVDCKIIENKGKIAFHFILTKNKNMVTINRSRK